jgi:hypothetical protein
MLNKKRKWRWLKVSGLSLIALGILLVTILLTLPFILQYAVVKHFVSSNLQNTAIKNININLFSGNFQIEGFSASQNEFRHLDIGNLKLDFEWIPALNKTIHFENIEIDSLDINVQQTENGQLIFGYERKKTSKPIDDQTVVEEYIAEQSIKNQPWTVLIDEFRLTNSKIAAYNREAKTRVQVLFDIVLDDMQADSHGNLRFSNMAVENLKFYLQDELTTQWARWSIDSLTLINNQLAIKEITVTDLVSTLTRFANGNFLIGELARQFVIPDRSKKSATEGNEIEQLASPFSWQLGGLVVGGDSQIILSDNSFSPALNRKLLIDTFELSAINSNQATNKTNMDIAFSSTQENEITIKGSAAPLLENPEVELEFNFRQINLIDISPYIAQATGYKVRTGILNLNAALHIADNQIKLDNQLDLHKLDLRLSSEESAADFNKKMTLPLATVLNILQDGEGNISLSVPVDGALDDPDFHLGSAINIAVAESLKAASLSYIKYAIQPWGAALFLGEKLTDSIGGLNFEPVVFAPGAATITPEASAYLDKLAHLLTKKSKLTITACPITTPSDKHALQKAKRKSLSEAVLLVQLKLLAEERYSVIKKYLADQHQIAGKQIIKCLAEYRDVQALNGAVELRL